jgi:hypothetical protein
MKLTVKEPAKEIKVFQETDITVVGGGPAGIAAAIAAARNGAHTVLLERYGHLGGMATGGLVILIMPMSDGTESQQIAGICQEIIDRLDVAGAALHPKKEEIGSGDKKTVDRLKQYPFFVVDGRVRLSALVDPEILKCVLNDMMIESGVKLLLHSWGTKAIVEEKKVNGIIFESKSGRQAILSKIVIDATGDGDIFASAGAKFDCTMDPKLRSSKLALVFQVANINVKEFIDFRQTKQSSYNELIRELEQIGGFPMALRSSRDDVLWFNNFLPDLNPLDVNDLTWVEVNARKKMLFTYDFFKKKIPGFSKSYIMNTASQTGVRSSRRLAGEYIITNNDLRTGAAHKDTIAVCPSFTHTVSKEHPHMHIPYRSLVPREIENLLVAGRCLSSDLIANDMLAPIQFCIAMGQAAGTAGALSLSGGIKVRNIDYKILQKCLEEQGVPLPIIG